MIRIPKDQDLSQITGLWQEAFGDSQEETAFYFMYRHRHENMLVMEDKGKITGMLSMLPMVLVSGKATLPARYVFAVATGKPFRGRGISTRLMEHAHIAMKSQGVCASVLVPANSELFAFYEKRGYHPAFWVDEIQYANNQIPPAQSGHASLCSAEEYQIMRDDLFKSSPLYARWDLDAMRFIEKSLRSSGGGLLRLETPQGIGIAACEWRGEGVRVSELSLENMEILDALSTIKAAIPAKHYQVRKSEISNFSRSTRPFGMIRWLSPPPRLTGHGAPHLGFAKD